MRSRQIGGFLKKNAKLDYDYDPLDDERPKVKYEYDPMDSL